MEQVTVFFHSITIHSLIHFTLHNTISPAQGLNVHGQMFTPMQYHVAVPLMSQPIMPGHLPFFQSGQWSTKDTNIGKCETCREWHVSGPSDGSHTGQQLLY